MFITGLGTATPPNRFSQQACWEALRTSTALPRLKPRSQALLKKVLQGKNGIESRYLAFDDLAEAFDLAPDTMHARYVRYAPTVAARAAERALQDAGLKADRIDGVIVSTCTGYLCPGLTSYVIEELGLPRDGVALDLVGQGCGAALPNMQTAAGLLASAQAENVLSICVEICSAAFYLDDDPGVLISACLFGDGAGAAVLSRSPSQGKRRIEWVKAKSRIVPEHREQLRFEQCDGMLRNRLESTVPTLAAREAQAVFAELSEEARLPRSGISAWIVHAGGRDVLVALQEALGLTGEELRWSADVLREYGNLSSPFVYFVLEAALRAAAPGGSWYLASFGAGFSTHAALLEVEE